MGNIERYFENRDKDKPPPLWIYGDRVSGKVSKTPVVGMVIRENYNDPSLVLVHLDLPIKVDGELRHVLYVPAKGMKKRKDI